MHVRPRALPGLLGILLVLGACTTSDPGNPRSPTPSTIAPKVPVKIAFLEDLSTEDSENRVGPAFQGLRLGIDTAALSGDLPVQVEVVGEDTQGDPATAAEIAQEVAADPTFVAVVVAPFFDETESVGAVLDDAGIPTISLSTIAVGLSANGWTTWLRAVADQAEQAAALTRLIRGLPATRRGVCVLGDGGVASNGLVHRVAGALAPMAVLDLTVLPEEAASGSFVSEVETSACGVAFWGGFSGEAATIWLRLTSAGLQKVVLLGADGTKDPAYLEATGRAGEGTIVSCPCADLSTSTRLADQRFIQNYQAEHGTPPGIYAAEGWDVARMLVAAFRAGATTRADLATAMPGLSGFTGLANTYLFQADGDLAPEAAAVRFFRDEGGRWIPLDDGVR